jgi:hypothetical protein
METVMKKQLTMYLILSLTLFFAGCTGSSDSDSSSNSPDTTSPIMVNSLGDEEILTAAAGDMTFRAALAAAADGQPIMFDQSLDGGTIELSVIGEEHSILKGEVMYMEPQANGAPITVLVGYFDRDYGRSALYAQKNVVIDASTLPNGITLKWTGGERDPARVLAVYGDLTMINVSVTGGWSVAEDLLDPVPQECPYPEDESDIRQCSTRARGGAIAVWGTARIFDCKLYDNHVRQGSVLTRSRDGGAFGGGLYSDIVEMENCIVSGNSVTGSGVSGGGVFTVGGRDASGNTSSINRSSITGNSLEGALAYGGGVYSDGGGITESKTLKLINSTIARNKVSCSPCSKFFGYWRGGGVYMSNGYMHIHGSTIVENEVHGTLRTDNIGKPSLAGGVAATIGDAHAVEDMKIGHSIIAGNTVHDKDGVFLYDQDIFTGSLLHFKSRGYNLFGVIDFSQMLVPVGENNWESFSRRHYPKVGDIDGVDVGDVLDVPVTNSDSIPSVGVDNGKLAVLYYNPLLLGSALDQVPAEPYQFNEIYAEYNIADSDPNNFLSIMLDRVETHYSLADDFDTTFIANFEAFLNTVDSDTTTSGTQPYPNPLDTDNPINTLTETLWFGPDDASGTWPRELYNYPYIHFWHRLDAALLEAAIPWSEVLGDNAWDAMFDSGSLDEDSTIIMDMQIDTPYGFTMLGVDQLGTARPVNEDGDIGAIELP